MINCRTSKDRMIEAFYGGLDPAEKERFDDHLSSCPECASEYSVMAATLKLMDKRERPDPGPEFWDGYWDRLLRRKVWEEAGEGRRPSLGARFLQIFSRLPRWSYQTAGAAALLLVGILIGSRLINPTGGGARMETVTVSAPLSTSGAGDSGVVQAENYIERSKILLLGLVNYDAATEDAYAFDLGRKKTMSRELAAEAPAIRGALNERGQKRLRGLVSDLEVIMMQIANLGSGQDVEGVELIKQGVDRRGLFLKIDLDRMGRDARDPVEPASPKGETKLPKKNKI
ncbi:MAG: zf-HC2 domain-containing protein [Acidobacteria bacterium]|nr:zf-HC2 domain-containing protein [Acidobacteriota bacterium]